MLIVLLQDRQGQDWRRVCEAAVQSRRGMDKVLATCTFGSEDLLEVGHKRCERLISWICNRALWIAQQQKISWGRSRKPRPHSVPG